MLNSQDDLDRALYSMVSMGLDADVYLYEIVALIELGADVDYQDDKLATPLHITTNADVASVLLASGASLDIRDWQGKTPYERHQALCEAFCISPVQGEAHEKICDLLIEETHKRERQALIDAIDSNANEPRLPRKI